MTNDISTLQQVISPYVHFSVGNMKVIRCTYLLYKYNINITSCAYLLYEFINIFINM